MIKRRVIWTALAVLLLGLALPESHRIPVAGATPADWNAKSFWCFPWGVSGVHKGIDIFAATGTPVTAATAGVVVFAGDLALGGHVVWVLGAKWRLHYYAHLERTLVHGLQIVRAGQAIGAVGASGNARGKPPHLHYSIVSLLPIVTNVRFDLPKGWLRMFYLDPNAFLTAQIADG